MSFLSSDESGYSGRYSDGDGSGSFSSRRSDDELRSQGVGKIRGVNGRIEEQKIMAERNSSCLDRSICSLKGDNFVREEKFLHV